MIIMVNVYSTTVRIYTHRTCAKEEKKHQIAEQTLRDNNDNNSNDTTTTTTTTTTLMCVFYLNSFRSKK